MDPSVFEPLPGQWLSSYTAEGIKWAYRLPGLSPGEAVDAALVWHHSLSRKLPYDVAIVRHSHRGSLVLITTLLTGVPCPTQLSALGPTPTTSPAHPLWTDNSVS
jgi:hypothetical protein